ncbi:MAG: TetR/AcrR family transcriptional regulator [Gammaproteobacteria bacterium]|jgi:TetR/AcrR family transcriptional repressor of lmrAB and yxaGH operons
MANPRSQSKQTLLAALRPVFADRGYEGATLSQLAAATGLGKASLYHHFPGGKAEMAAILLRESVAELERVAFARLSSGRPPAQRLADFVDGFRDYVQDGEGRCLIVVMGQGAAEAHGETVARQYADWLRRLAATFEETGIGAKKAERRASELLAGLYGHLQLAAVTRSPDLFKRYAKRLKRSLTS